MKKGFLFFLTLLISFTVISCDEQETTQNNHMQYVPMTFVTDKEIMDDLVNYAETNDLEVEFYDIGTYDIVFVADYKAFLIDKLEDTIEEINLNGEPFTVSFFEDYDTVIVYSRYAYAIISQLEYHFYEETLDDDLAIKKVGIVDSDSFAVEVYTTTDMLMLEYGGQYFDALDYTVIYDFDHEIIFSGNYHQYQYDIFYTMTDEIELLDREVTYFQFTANSMTELETTVPIVGDELIRFGNHVFIKRYEVVINYSIEYIPYYDVYVRNPFGVLEYRYTIGGEGYQLDVMNMNLLRVFHTDCDFYDSSMDLVRTFIHEYDPEYQIYPLDDEFYIKIINETDTVQIVDYANNVIDSKRLWYGNDFTWDKVIQTEFGYLLDCGQTKLLWTGEELVDIEGYINSSMFGVFYYEVAIYNQSITTDYQTPLNLFFYNNNGIQGFENRIMVDYLMDNEHDYTIIPYSPDFFSVVWDRSSLEYDYLYHYYHGELTESGEIIAETSNLMMNSIENNSYLIRTEDGNYKFCTFGYQLVLTTIIWTLTPY